MAKVTLYHPDLPNFRLHVNERAAKVHQASGWLPEPPQPEADEPAPGDESEELDIEF